MSCYRLLTFLQGKALVVKFCLALFEFSHDRFLLFGLPGHELLKRFLFLSKLLFKVLLLFAQPVNLCG